jgi:protease I
MTSPTKTVAMVLAKNFEDIEAIGPLEYLESRGVEVVTIGLEPGEIEGKKGGRVVADTTFSEVTQDQFDGFDLLLIPGGGSPENLRINDVAVDFTRRFVESGRAVASICHGPQLLISAKVLKGRSTTSVNKIRDDVINAGAHYVDEQVVIDDNLISSRVPDDLPAFYDAIGAALGIKEEAHV